MLKFTILIATLVALTAGYDFKDSDFNEYLLEDLKALNDQIRDPIRVRRDTAVEADKCSHHDKDHHCCKTEHFASHESFREIKKECYKEVVGDKEEAFDIFNCDKLKEIKENVYCVSECVSKKFELLDDKSELKREALIEKLKKKFGDEKWKVDITEATVDKCLAEIKKLEAEDKEEHKCKPHSLRMGHCMWKEFVKACPKEKQTDSPKCIKLREKIEKNDEPYLKKLHFHKYLHHHHDSSES